MISRYLLKMPQLAKCDLLKDFTVPQVAQKHGWPEPLVWSQALVNKDEIGGQHTYFSRITCAICL